MFHSRHIAIGLIAALLPLVTGCQTDRGKTVGQATAAGTLIGAAAGAAIGYAVDEGDGAAWGAAIGAAAGAGTGYVVGSNEADDKEEYARLEAELQSDIAHAKARRADVSQEVAAIHADINRLEQEQQALLATNESLANQQAQIVARQNELDRSIEASRVTITKVEEEIRYQRDRQSRYPADWALRQALEQEIRQLESQRLELDRSLSKAVALRDELGQR